MPNKHSGTDRGGCPARGGRKKIQRDFRVPVELLGCAIALQGAARDQPVIVVLGILFVVAVLGRSFTVPDGWLKHLKNWLK